MEHFVSVCSFMFVPLHFATEVEITSKNENPEKRKKWLQRFGKV